MWAEAYGQPQKDSTLESWIALTYIAAKTQNIKLGTIVTPIPFRPPAILAKMVATMDVLSSGRAILGVGAGWSQTEFEGYSTWDDPKTRVDKTREGVELILQLWQKPKVRPEICGTGCGKSGERRRLILHSAPSTHWLP